MADQFRAEQRYYFVKTAELYLGKPYIWGGDDFSGFDCSGLALECLYSAGIMKKTEGDFTADMLWNKFNVPFKVVHPSAGAMAFWFKEGKSYHVAVCISDFFCVTADGGGSKTLTIEDAIKQNAFIKIRPINHRATAPMFVDVFK